MKTENFTKLIKYLKYFFIIWLSIVGGSLIGIVVLLPLYAKTGNWLLSFLPNDLPAGYIINLFFTLFIFVMLVLFVKRNRGMFVINYSDFHGVPDALKVGYKYFIFSALLSIIMWMIMVFVYWLQDWVFRGLY